jgi:transposase
MKFRQQYTTSQKKRVLAHLALNDHKSTANHFGIHLSMVYKWQAKKDTILSSSLESIKPGSGRRAMFPLIEFHIHQEAIQSRRQGICVTLEGIAQSMRNAVDEAHFKASSGWIKGYKKRHP